MRGSGATPSSFRNTALLRRANSSISVDLPIRRRPRHVTRDATGFAQSDSSCRKSFSRPTNMHDLRFKTRESIPKRPSITQHHTVTKSANCTFREGDQTASRILLPQLVGRAASQKPSGLCAGGSNATVRRTNGSLAASRVAHTFVPNVGRESR